MKNKSDLIDTIILRHGSTRWCTLPARMLTSSVLLRACVHNFSACLHVCVLKLLKMLADWCICVVVCMRAQRTNVLVYLVPNVLRHYACLCIPCARRVSMLTEKADNTENKQFFIDCYTAIILMIKWKPIKPLTSKSHY